ncbi:MULTISPECIES: YjdF family protein [Clostridium]|uniref:YjdF family protein n=1 Tax=Clostridium TaxID=1485 RepID=UPI0008250B6F|nr:MULTISPECIES: YjdF family protein [Clostridium]PJI06768.1 DUF2992 domain-containing protein [Clostridium sp. CT7]
MNIVLTVFFEDPFWVGLFERSCKGKYEAAKVVFGAEPKDYEVYEFILKRFKSVKFSDPIKEENSIRKKINPKRLQRKIKKEVSGTVGTKAQNAIKLDMENKKVARKASIKLKKKEYDELRFNLKRQKKKLKRKGH